MWNFVIFWDPFFKILKDKTIQESLPSETIIAWTEPSVQAIAEPPKVTPSILQEGDNFQVIDALSFHFDIFTFKSSKMA